MIGEHELADAELVDRREDGAGLRIGHVAVGVDDAGVGRAGRLRGRARGATPPATALAASSPTKKLRASSCEA